jgi:hypothetical protein
LNNAARSTGDGYKALDAATLDAHYAVNLRATALLSVVFAQRFDGETGGRIVNLTSAEVGHKGMIVNAVNLGPTDTGWMTKELRQELSAKFSTRRVGEPEDAARLVAFLASDQAAWITVRSFTPREAFCAPNGPPSNPIEDVCFTVPAMNPGKKLATLWRRIKLRRAKRDDELHAHVRGPLYPRPVLYALLALFGVSAMLSMDWFGLLLLNSDGVVRQMGIISALRVTAALMGGVALTSALLIAHYKRLYTYTSEENVFFTLAFLLSFLLGGPCALAGIFA